MRIFFDMEFTGLHQYTTPISIGLITEMDEAFYAEFSDYNQTQLDKWIIQNVLPGLGKRNYDNVRQFEYHIGNKEEITVKLEKWLKRFTDIEIWSDCLAYDWVLFSELWQSWPEKRPPWNVYYIPFDICTVLKIKGIDPDIDREKFVEIKDNGMKHNALWDAIIIKKCYEKLMEIKL